VTPLGSGYESEFDVSIEPESRVVERVGAPPTATQFDLFARLVMPGLSALYFWRFLVRLQFDNTAGGCVKLFGKVANFSGFPDGRMELGKP
jgi:hypothetical protein